MPEIFILHVLEQPGNRLFMRPLPGHHRPALLFLEAGEREAGQRFLGGDVMIQDQEAGGLARHRFQRRPRVAEVHDDDLTAGEVGRRRIPVLDRDEPGRGKTFPDCPRGAKAVQTLRVVQDDVGSRRGAVLGVKATHRMGSKHITTHRPIESPSGKKCVRPTVRPLYAGGGLEWWWVPRRR